MKRILFLLIFLFYTKLSFSQTDKIINCKVVCQKVGVPNIQITNLVNEKSCVSDEFGNFSILAKQDDMLVFISNIYYYKRKILEIEDFNIDRIIINIDKKIEVLNEVFVTRNNNAQFNEPYSAIKSYTPAERRLTEACDFKPTALLTGLIGLSLPLNPIINAISGRTSQLKKELTVERNEMLLEKIKYLYPEDYYIKKLKISQEQIAGFQY